VAQKHDRARAKWAEKWRGAAVPLSVGELGLHLTQCRAEANLLTKWYPGPSSRLATIDMGRAVYGRVAKPRNWGLGAVPLSVGELGPHLTQCGFG